MIVFQIYVKKTILEYGQSDHFGPNIESRKVLVPTNKLFMTQEAALSYIRRRSPNGLKLSKQDNMPVFNEKWAIKKVRVRK